MANLEILDNVVHRGIILKKGVIVSDEHQGLAEVAQSLIDEGLARETKSAPTHSIALVNTSQEAVPLGENGQLPNAAGDEAAREQAKAAQIPATPAQQTQTEQVAQAESQTENKGKLLDRIRGAGNQPPAPTGANPADVAADAQAQA